MKQNDLIIISKLEKVNTGEKGDSHTSMLICETS